ncbi:hypothetical protein [Pseudomonas sp. CCI2.4]|uniref:hypothetical protein n=1 Tax=Pseudomonas sp. CCI2.4 TaxID=3048617 RepID=UPI002B22DC82|nr:hypothetical protein [Pseudomonas sp. CCI2.4]MEB0133447.1 hypothetical protein [Pseudomonas sp. CCI2.4]
MKRTDHDDLEGFAVAAMIGLLAAGSGVPLEKIATKSFDMAEAFQKERLQRLGEKPPHDF